MHSNQGFTLLEILIAMALSSAALLGYYAMLSESNLISQQLAQQRQGITDAQTALQLMRHSVALSGYHATESDNNLFPTQPLYSLPKSSPLSFTDRQVLLISHNNPNTLNNTDTLTVRYQVAADGLLTDCFGHNVQPIQQHTTLLELSYFVSKSNSLSCKASLIDLETGQIQNLGREPMIANVTALSFDYITKQGYQSIPPAVAEDLLGARVSLQLQASSPSFSALLAIRQTGAP